LDGVYKVKKGLAIPLAINTGLVFLLLCISFFKKSSPVEIVVLTIILIPLVLITLECFLREVAIQESGMMIKKILRRRVLGWGEVTAVGMVALRNKVYLVLTTTKGFHVISNAYDNFAGLVRGIVDHVEPEKVEEPVKAMADHPVRKISDVVSAWVGAVVLAGIVYVKIFIF